MLVNKRRRWLLRSVIGWMAVVGLVVTGVTTQALTGAAADPPSLAKKIRPELTKAFEAKTTTDFWIRFQDEADLTQASKLSNWNERGAAVAAALRKTAAESQAKVRAELNGLHLKYQTFWASNAIRVSGGSMSVAQSLAEHAEVEGLYAPIAYEAPKVTPAQTVQQVNSLEWGLANINADDVWSQYGDKGAGIVIANIDTGVQYDHPALVNKYRGNNGDGTFDHNYSWFDAAGTSPDAPSDTNGHGTHTMGTMVGDDGAGNQIGVAPDVKWIGGLRPGSWTRWVVDYAAVGSVVARRAS
ncbi:S8 family serine peptidase [Nocardioides speluncae]|uniref:S8 family serine peptidase n=1 Tax=Nocardioides speluncae TaxID=2670337 RepID=UPI001F0CC26D|nr:S8 family serine peptidase [Nocardioides speluncae]